MAGWVYIWWALVSAGQGGRGVEEMKRGLKTWQMKETLPLILSVFA
jgi:hypothetical protein